VEVQYPFWHQQYRFGGWEDAMDILPDINNDGKDEVIIGCGGGNEMVYCISGATGVKLWQYGSESNNYDGDIYGLRTGKDFNGDGRKDVLISASGETNFGGRQHYCVNGLNGQEIFNVDKISYDPEATNRNVGLK
jgi:outer membrane protein assembly factor BamB